jgi:hypothetical protein
MFDNLVDKANVLFVVLNDVNLLKATGIPPFKSTLKLPPGRISIIGFSRVKLEF